MCPIDLIDKIKPKNGGKFPMVDAEDVQMPDGTRLDEAMEEWEFLLEDGTTVKKQVMITNA